MSVDELQRLYNYVSLVKWSLPDLLRHLGCDINSLDDLQEDLRGVLKEIDSAIVHIKKNE